jgi:uncharacterized membrane protein (DUF373 family)
MFVLAISLILGTIHLIISTYKSIAFEEPYHVVDVKDLYPIFNLILIIVVGIELLKSIFYISDHDKIPVKTILLIAIVAMANKAITLDVKAAGMNIMIGISVLILTMAISYFFTKDSNSPADEG